jgi:DNA-binding CsgD family transcriptional regulator
LIDQDSSSGIIILNDSLKLIHMNNKARNFCKNLEVPYRWDGEQDENEYLFPLIPHSVTEDCLQLREQMRRTPLHVFPLPICRILDLPEGRKYSLCSQFLSGEINKGKGVFYAVKIDDFARQFVLNMGSLQNNFSLTKRESEVLVNIFSGLKNAEIAEKLFIGEFTVKKHLHHIFEKMNVSSRIALIRKTLEYQSCKPQA